MHWGVKIISDTADGHADAGPAIDTFKLNYRPKGPLQGGQEDQSNYRIDWVTGSTRDWKTLVSRVFLFSP